MSAVSDDCKHFSFIIFIIDAFLLFDIIFQIDLNYCFKGIPSHCKYVYFNDNKPLHLLFK